MVAGGVRELLGEGRNAISLLPFDQVPNPGVILVSPSLRPIPRLSWALMSALFKCLYYLHFCWDPLSLVWAAMNPCIDICVPSNCSPCFRVACCSAFCFPYGSQRTPVRLCHVSVKSGCGSHIVEGFSALHTLWVLPRRALWPYSSVFPAAYSTPATLAGNISASYQVLCSNQLSEESVFHAVTLDPSLKEALLSSAWTAKLAWRLTPTLS